MLNCNLAVLLASEDSLQFKSKTTKYLHTIFDKTILDHVCDALYEAGLTHVLIVAGQNKDTFMEHVKYAGAEYCETEAEAIQKISQYSGCDFFVLDGDMPLITTDLITDMWKAHKNNGNNLTTTAKSVSLSCFKASVFENNTWYSFSEARQAINGQQGEYNIPYAAALTRIFTRADMAYAGTVMRTNINNRFMENGVTIIDPQSTFLSADVEIGMDTIIYPNTIITHATVIGENCEIGPNSSLKNMQLGNGVHFVSSSGSGSSIGDHTMVGPFAFIRPHSKIGAHVKIGDFVEIKNSVIGDYTKASHLAYIGDTDAGQNINFGCAAITVNYDGLHKFRTVIEDDAFIGSNSNLISPVLVGKGAYVAAGSTITDDVPQNTLAIARERQVIKSTWKDRRTE